MKIPVNQPPLPEPDIPKTDAEKDAMQALARKIQWDMMQCIPDGTNIVVVFTAFLRGAMDSIEDCPIPEAQIAMIRQAYRKVKETESTLVATAVIDPIIEILGSLIARNKK